MSNTKYIVVEGPIGVGKSSLAKILANEFQARSLFERIEDNPFLPKFYKARQTYAFQNQTFFLLNRYQQHGLPGLTIQWAPGQPGRIPESFASTLHQWIIEGPQSCGLDRANWTYEELAVHFYRTTGMEVKRTAMRVFCQRHQIRPYRPTYRYLRGDPHKQQAAREELAALKKSASW